jgi:hypothetical protein
MPAPNTAYLNNGNALRMSEEDLAGGVLANYDALIAAYIYGAGNIKALFYLDAITEVEITDDAGTVIQTGFIGLIINGSYNYNHHAASRQFKGALPVYDDADNLITDYVALNDGGLNTLGNGANTSQSSSNSGINLTGNFLSSYYDSSSNYGFRHKKNSDSVWASINSNTVITSQNGGVITMQIPSGIYVAGDSVNVQAFIVNPEGAYYSNTQTFTVLRVALVWKGPATFASQAGSASNVSVFSDTQPAGVGSYISTNINGSGNISAGYYTYDGYWFEISIESGINKSKVIAGGVNGIWPSGDPATPVRFLDVTFTHFASTYTGGCPVVTGGNGTAYNCYFDNVDNVYRTGATSSSVYIANGFYWNGQTAGNGALIFIQIESGVKIAEGDCAAGIYIGAV